MSEQKRVARTGNEAMAEAMRQINPDVVAAYPITPATEIAQLFSSFVADGTPLAVLMTTRRFRACVLLTQED